jgi:hypothetical protein
MSLKRSLLAEPSFPALEGRSIVVEDETISPLPNQSDPQHKELYEEGI